jgi:hypothetical protein
MIVITADKSQFAAMVHSRKPVYEPYRVLFCFQAAGFYSIVQQFIVNSQIGRHDIPPIFV